MTDIEKKALALVNEVALRRVSDLGGCYHHELEKALRRAIEQHEAFKREVSDAVRVLDEFITGSEDYKRGSRTDSVHIPDGRSVKFARFIIAEADEVTAGLALAVEETLELVIGDEDARRLRAAIEARGGRIVWEGE